MKLVIISNTDAMCGNAQYARNLKSFIEPQVERVVILPPGEGTVEEILKSPMDVVLINWHPAVVPMTVEMVRVLQGYGKRVVLILQNSLQRMPVAENDILTVVDAVVAHEPIAFKMAPMFSGEDIKRLWSRFFYIPHPVLDVDGLPPVAEPLSIGTAGFQFPWKRPDVVVEAARRCACRANILCPPHKAYENQLVARQLCHMYGGTHVDTTFLSEANVIRTLAQNALNIFWFQSESIHDQYGQTGSARLGISAKRPMIVSRHRKFLRLLEEYSDCFYIADTEDDVYRLAVMILDDVRNGKFVVTPAKVVDEQDWVVAAETYWHVCEMVLGGDFGGF